MRRVVTADEGSTDWEAFLEELAAAGCEILAQGDEDALVTPPDSESSFALTESDGFLNLSICLHDHRTDGPLEHPTALAEFAMTIHSRLLGCRLCSDSDGDPCLVADIYPSMRTPEQLVVVMGHVEWVAQALCPLIESAVGRGIIPSETETDAAFGMAWEADD